MIVGIGLDVCEVSRIRDMASKAHGQRFLERVYTEAERAYCDSKLNRFERYAGRFAAKEAAMKSIGTGWSRGVAWKEFEVRRLPSGQPIIEFHGKAREYADKLGVKRALVTISHTTTQAIAQVVLEG